MTVFGLIISIVGTLFLDQILLGFGATPNLLGYAREYTKILLIGAPIFVLTVSTNNIIRSEGNAKSAMIAMILGMVLNIILDPIFIFGLHLGVAGAAWATVISRCATLVYILVYYVSGKSILKIKLHHFKPDFKMYGRIFALGLPGFVRQVSGSVIMIIANHILKFYGGEQALMTIGGKAATGGDVYISLFGVINRVMAFVMMPMFGVTHGLQPIVGYNFGAKKYERVIEVVNKSVYVLCAVGCSASRC